MSIDYEAVTRAWRRNKAALTRARKVGPARVIEVCDQAFADFERYGYPDQWHTFNIARQDAQLELQRSAW